MESHASTNNSGSSSHDAHHEHTGNEPLDYNFIIDGIYIGTNQCCMTGLNEVLKKEGITADISLEDTRLDHPFGVEMYTWIPTPNHTPPSLSQLAFGIEALRELVRQRRKVYVHCRNGHGRAPTLVAAYFVSTGKTTNEAIALIKEKRPSIHLEKSQEEALRTIEKEHKNK